MGDGDVRHTGLSDSEVVASLGGRGSYVLYGYNGNDSMGRPTRSRRRQP